MKQNINIGNLDRRVILLEKQTGKSTTGSTTTNEVSYASAWVHLDDVSGNESLDGKVIALNVRKYTMRYNSYVSQNAHLMSVQDEDGVYNIHSVALIGRKDYMVLKCSKRE